MMELVARKRIEPGDDILSELIAERDGALSDAEIAQLGNAVLLFGYETTIVRSAASATPCGVSRRRSWARTSSCCSRPWNRAT